MVGFFSWLVPAVPGGGSSAVFAGRSGVMGPGSSSKCRLLQHQAFAMWRGYLCPRVLPVPFPDLLTELPVPPALLNMKSCRL